MRSAKWLGLFINVLGGTAVLGSYAIGFLTRSDAAAVLWGGVPPAIRPVYTINMFLAAAGYFAFSIFIFFKTNAADIKIFNRFGFSLFNILFALILIPSALWLPLSFLAVDNSSLLFLWAVRLVLALVALGSLGLFFALLNMQPRHPKVSYRLALAGCIPFCVQTVILDAIVWVYFFKL